MAPASMYARGYATWDGNQWVPKTGSTGRHAKALLLPDARVLALGGESKTGEASPHGDKAEIFEPPYLFVGIVEAARPEIGRAPEVVEYDTLFRVHLGDGWTYNDIGRVTLVGTSAVTHNFDQNRRFLALDFALGNDSNILNVSAPAIANLAPPGYYMLFVISNGGVPSVAEFIRLE